MYKLSVCQFGNAKPRLAGQTKEDMAKEPLKIIHVNVTWDGPQGALAQYG